MADLKRILLSNTFWKFKYGLSQEDTDEDPGITERWYEQGIPFDENRLKVYVPSTWSYYQNKKRFYHFGTGWYQTSFYLPLRWGSGNGKKITLVFNGANYRTTVWLNGKKVGYHDGGFTKFWFEINEYAKFGSDNQLIVQVDNRYLPNRIPWEKIPPWMNYGGIFRQVYLKQTSLVCLDDIKITNSISFDKPLGEGYDSSNAKVQIRFSVHDYRSSTKPFKGCLLVSVKDSFGKQTTEIPVSITEGNSQISIAEIEVEKPILWSPDNPYLYDFSFQLIDEKNRMELDRENIRWGIRKFHVNEHNFYLNNRRIVLRGINRFEDHPDVGSSLNPRLIYHDLNIMKEAHINCIRTTYFPPHQSLLELADEMGFLVLEQIPVWGFSDEDFNKKNLVEAEKQLWEMIHRDKNHCSIITWVISSDCETGTAKSREFMSNILTLSRELDPFRTHSLVSKNPLNDKTFDLVDFIISRTDAGWFSKYDTSPEDSAKFIDDIWSYIQFTYPDTPMKPLVITEFGAEAIAGFKSFSNAHWSENYQYDLLRSYISEIMKKPFIAGACIGHFQDFQLSPFGGFLKKPQEMDNKGIVDVHRQPKISFYIVQRMYEKWKKLVME
ncbi:MAG: glycoside hydrolase family 2 protein [Promethearchaeota archaeon]